MTYLEILATIYVIANSGFILSAFFRDKILIDQKAQMDSLQVSLNEYKKIYKEMVAEINTKNMKIHKLQNFYDSHNANKEAEVK